ncbi:hypothetical protein M422DRAFT_267627 [Sphaerobolus stellatus SS14]|uniref:Uncharacterized protein n=1 Tax=Sphaerobolus stellatus (strain SS14) TaxID=990650 RepID=A0A0C9TLM3_SPHS4|nr:hypothetical protein M422DRAFT_267627 [Sphaerobolus stellatus SS14]
MDGYYGKIGAVVSFPDAIYVSTAESNTNDKQPTPIPVATVETSADVPPTCAQDTMASECVPEVIPGKETVMISQVVPAILSTVQEESSTSSMPEPSQPSVQPANSDSPRPANIDLPPLQDAISQPGDTSSQPPQARGVTGQPGAGINLWRLFRPMTISTLSGMNAGTPGATTPSSLIRSVVTIHLVGRFSSGAPQVLRRCDPRLSLSTTVKRFGAALELHHACSSPPLSLLQLQ